jgi:hypothetical protein
MLIFKVLELTLTLTQQMRDKSNKTIEFRAGKTDKNFTERNKVQYDTNYAGCSVSRLNGLFLFFDLLLMGRWYGQ